MRSIYASIPHICEINTYIFRYRILAGPDSRIKANAKIKKKLKKRSKITSFKAKRVKNKYNMIR